MSLTLSSRELTILVDAMAVISSPLAYASPGEWHAAVHHTIEPLLGAEASAATYALVAPPVWDATALPAVAIVGGVGTPSRPSGRARKIVALLRPACRASISTLAERGATRGRAMVLPGHAAPPHGLSDAELRRRFALTPREIEVARLLAVGRSAREVAAALGLSYYTARHHVEHVLAKLGVRTRAAVASVTEAAGQR